MTPHEVDSLSLRDMAVMTGAAVERYRERWRHTATLFTAVLNFGGMRGKSFRPRRPQELFPFAFDGASGEAWEEKVRRDWKRAFGE